VLHLIESLLQRAGGLGRRQIFVVFLAARATAEHLVGLGHALEDRFHLGFERAEFFAEQRVRVEQLGQLEVRRAHFFLVGGSQQAQQLVVVLAVQTVVAVQDLLLQVEADVRLGQHFELVVERLQRRGQHALHGRLAKRAVRTFGLFSASRRGCRR
jgi:hypothetical protein